MNQELKLALLLLKKKSIGEKTISSSALLNIEGYEQQMEQRFGFSYYKNNGTKTYKLEPQPMEKVLGVILEGDSEFCKVMYEELK